MSGVESVVGVGGVDSVGGVEPDGTGVPFHNLGYDEACLYRRSEGAVRSTSHRPRVSRHALCVG